MTTPAERLASLAEQVTAAREALRAELAGLAELAGDTPERRRYLLAVSKLDDAAALLRSVQAALEPKRAGRRGR